MSTMCLSISLTVDSGRLICRTRTLFRKKCHVGWKYYEESFKFSFYASVGSYPPCVLLEISRSSISCPQECRQISGYSLVNEEKRNKL